HRYEHGQEREPCFGHPPLSKQTPRVGNRKVRQVSNRECERSGGESECFSRSRRALVEGRVRRSGANEASSSRASRAPGPCVSRAKTFLSRDDFAFQRKPGGRRQGGR